MNCTHHPWVPLVRGACRRCAEMAALSARLLPCPTCGQRTLTRGEQTRGYHCSSCTAREEGPS